MTASTLHSATRDTGLDHVGPHGPRIGGAGPTHRLSRISPWSAAKVAGALYAAIGLLSGPLFALPMFLLGKGSLRMLLLWVVAPVVYAGLGFLLAGVTALGYNLIARWTGGIEVAWRATGSVSEPAP